LSPPKAIPYNFRGLTRGKGLDSNALRTTINAARRQAELEESFGIHRHRRFDRSKLKTPRKENYKMTTTQKQKAELLAEVGKKVNECKKCGLWETRNKTVLGAGNPDADLMFIGEAPGADEDMQGLPFVGRAGKLLTKMIAYINLTRDDIYIGNILKCRPPENRNPKPEEIGLCFDYLYAQLDIIQPKVIIALGGIAAHTLLENKDSVKSMRGKIHNYRGIDLIVTYHPAYLLRNFTEAEKDKVKVDLDRAIEIVGQKQ